VNEINSYVVEEFVTKVQIARKTNQKQVVLDMKEAQNLVDNLTLILSRALGNVQVSTNENTVTSVQMDGGSF
jgi:hypothetical protein